MTQIRCILCQNIWNDTKFLLPFRGILDKYVEKRHKWDTFSRYFTSIGSTTTKIRCIFCNSESKQHIAPSYISSYFTRICWKTTQIRYLVGVFFTNMSKSDTNQIPSRGIFYNISWKMTQIRCILCQSVWNDTKFLLPFRGIVDKYVEKRHKWDTISRYFTSIG